MLWREVWIRLGATGIPWKVAFDPADPVNTPRDLDAADPKVVAALRGTVEEFRAKGIPLDVPLGDKQAEPRGSERIAIPGCSEVEGCFNIISTRRDDQGNYDPYTGSSFVMVAGVRRQAAARAGRAILSLLAVREPAARRTIADQTKLFYAREKWLPMRFSESLRSRPDRGLLEAGGERPPVRVDAG